MLSISRFWEIDSKVEALNLPVTHVVRDDAERMAYARMKDKVGYVKSRREAEEVLAGKRDRVDPLVSPDKDKGVEKVLKRLRARINRSDPEKWADGIEQILFFAAEYALESPHCAKIAMDLMKAYKPDRYNPGKGRGLFTPKDYAEELKKHITKEE